MIRLVVLLFPSLWSEDVSMSYVYNHRLALAMLSSFLNSSSTMVRLCS